MNILVIFGGVLLYYSGYHAGIDGYDFIDFLLSIAGAFLIGFGGAQ